MLVSLESRFRPRGNSNVRLRVVPERDIGIISPYHAQCQKIRRALPKELEKAKVGSVEEFQGQVRRPSSRLSPAVDEHRGRNARSSSSRQPVARVI